MLAEDSALFRAGLVRVLEDLGVTVLAALPTGEALLAAVNADAPDVAILDIRMPPTFTDEGLGTAERLRERHPDVAVLLLSTYAEATSAARLLADGTRGKGYLLKDRVDDPRALHDALLRLTRGESVIDADLVARLVGARQADDALSGLTSREREVLQHMAEGRSNAAISQAMFLSPKTVEAHVSVIFGKLGLPPEGQQNRRVLAVLAWLKAQTEAG